MVGKGSCPSLRIILFFLFRRWFTMRPFVPFLEHRRDAVFPVSSPRTVVMLAPSPARSPEEEAERPQREEKEEKQDQEAEEPKAETKWAMEAIPIIWVGCWNRFPGGRFDGDRRSLRYTRLEGEIGNSRDGSDQYKSRYNS